MELKILESQTFYSALITACNHLVSQREHLNAINLFPVADGDTGDNMAATAWAVIQHSTPQPSMAETLKSISNAAISGARGNSGMIFSQFFNGLADYPPSKDQLDTRTFSELISHSIKSVRAAILNPVEGTIITVMDCWSESCERLAERHDCFINLINHSLQYIDKAVQNTSKTLDVLRDANVVDAGALGFYHFVSGFANYLANPQQLIRNPEPLSLEVGDHQFEHDGQPEHRYCTEAMISAEGIDKSKLAKTLEMFGDSIVLSGNSSVCRFHIHSNKPDEVFAAIDGLGDITQPKIDDMLRQFEVIHQRKQSIALVTDSSANLPQALLDQHQIHLIPLQLYFDDHHLLDHYCVNKETLYDRLATLKKYPSTSLPNPSRVKEKLSQLGKHYDHVLVISISQALSGTHDVFVKAAEHAENIHVINSKHTAGSQGLLLHYAAQLIEQGLAIEEIKQAIIEKISNTHIFVLIDQFESLIRSGRISKTSGRIAQFAHLKPIATLDKEGKVAICDKAFSQHKGFIKLITLADNLIKKTGPLASYNIIHAGIPEKAEQFAELTTEAFGKTPDFIDTVSSVIGLHSGKDCLALSVILEG